MTSCEKRNFWQADSTTFNFLLKRSGMLYAFKLGRKLRGEEPYCPEKGGKGGSSDKSAKYAAEAQKYAADLQNQQWQTIMKNLAPFLVLCKVRQTLGRHTPTT